MAPTSPTIQPTATPSIESTLGPTVIPTRHPSFFPSRFPTRDPTYRPSVSPPTVKPTLTPSFSPTTFQPSSVPSTPQPSNEPTYSPIALTDSPTSVPTNSKEIWQLSFPKTFSSMTDNFLINFGIFIIIAWCCAIIYIAKVRYQQNRWSFQSLYNSLSQNDSNGNGGKLDNSNSNSLKRRKIVKNKYEDYWGEDSEDQVSKHFPTRMQSTLSGVNKRISLGIGISTSSVVTDDNWDEVSLGSVHSHDGLNLTNRNL